MIKVMIVDDSAVARSVLQEALLTAPDMRVVGVAPDPLFALPKMEREWPDVIITDIEMPRLDGLGLAGRIRQNAAYREMPIILVTSLASDADRARGVEVGADAYITKGGFDQKALLDALQRLV